MAPESRRDFHSRPGRRGSLPGLARVFRKECPGPPAAVHSGSLPSSLSGSVLGLPLPAPCRTDLLAPLDSEPLQSGQPRSEPLRSALSLCLGGRLPPRRGSPVHSGRKSAADFECFADSSD